MPVRICDKCGIDHTRMWYKNLRGVGVLCSRCGIINRRVFLPDQEYRGAAFVMRWVLGGNWPYTLYCERSARSAR